jgi:WD40 repeat protein
MRISQCPECHSSNIRFFDVRRSYTCHDCGCSFPYQDNEVKRLRIFLSYGHDENEELVRLIKTDLEKRGHDVWFDKNEIKFGDDWRRSITDGIVESHRILSFLSKYSTRDPGVCLNEIAIAIGVKGGNIQTILVEGEKDVIAPSSISYVQWLDMHLWKEKRMAGREVWEKWYEEKFREMISVIESEESLRFAGEIETLSGYLKPISSDARISQLLRKGFVGREWLSDAVERWRTDRDRSSRIFWIMGNPGVGKSAFSAHLSHFGKDRIIAAQFCEWNMPDHRDASRVLRSLAFQMATRLPDYRKLLLTLPEIGSLEEKGPTELFDYLFANPLKMVIEGGRERYLILIDALDEAKEGNGNPLVDLLARHGPRLPDWLCFVVTSRPEKNVTDPLQGLNPYVIDTESEENKNDICTYIELELHKWLVNRPDSEDLVKQILEKSEGVFIYAERVCQDVKDGYLSLDHIEDFPKGLGNIYLQFFKRQFPNEELYRNNIRPALRVILAAKEALPLQLIGKLFNWNSEEQNDFIRLSGSLFPLLPQEGQMVIKPYHKSIIDWITVETTAGPFYLSIEEGHKTLAEFGLYQFRHLPEIMELYFVKWLPRHLLKLEKWDDLINLLCNLEYIQKKSAEKLTYHLVDDFNQTLKYLPDNAENIQKGNERQARMDNYTRDLIAYARGEITELQVPKKIPLWGHEKISAEIERMKTTPTRIDRLNDFRNFLGQEAGNLQRHANLFPHFATQQAWNYAERGPVGMLAENEDSEIKKSLLLRSSSTRPSFNPLPQALLTLKGHTLSVYSVSITPDGQRGISGSFDGTCILWDLNTGEVLLTLKGHSSSINSVSITPDARLAISGSHDKTCILWDLSTGDVIHTLIGHTRYVNAVCITTDGKRAISGSSDSTCILWDLTNGSALKILKGHANGVNALSITPDGKLAISGSIDKTCILWDLVTGEPLHILHGHTNWVSAVSITPDGLKAISASYDKLCILWDLTTGKLIKTLHGHNAKANAVAITPDGQWAISVSDDKACILWDLTTGEILNILKGHTDLIHSLSITPDGMMAISGSGDKTCILWDIKSSQIFKTKAGHFRYVTNVSISLDGKLAISGSRDNTCIIWDLITGEAKQILKGHSDWVLAVSITPDNQRAISGSKDKTCIVWDLTTGKVCKILKGHTSDVHSVHISPDGRRAISGSGDSTCILWDLATGKIIQTLKGHTNSVFAVYISPDGKYAMSGSRDKTCILWDLAKGKAIKTLIGHTDWVMDLAITPDGKRAISASFDKECLVWDLTKEIVIQNLKWNTRFVNFVSITADGNQAVMSSTDQTLTIRDLENEEKKAIFPATSRVTAASSFPGGIIGGEFSGKTFILNVNKDILCPYRGIVTVRQVWDYRKHQFQSLSADCPICGGKFDPPASVVLTINAISKKAGLKPEASPCLELPKEAWEEPGLLGNCPKCGEELKFNPFISENGSPKSVWKFWQPFNK